MKVVRNFILLSFLVIAFKANSQMATAQTPAANQQVIDWLNEKFSLYRLKNPDFPNAKIAKVKFDGCSLHINSAFQVPDSKTEDITINLATVGTIDYLGLKGGMLYIEYDGKIVYINFDVSKEPDLLSRIRSSIDYLKNYCTNN